MDHSNAAKKHNKLGLVSGVYIPVCLNIFSILLFLRFGSILGQIGLVGMLGLLVSSYLIDVVTTLSLSAVSSNGEVKSGGTYYLISRSLGVEFGGSIGLLFFLAQVLNTAMNVVGLITVLKSSFEQTLPQTYWGTYLLQTVALLSCTALSLGGSGMFAKASNALLVILGAAILTIPLSALFRQPFEDPVLDVSFTGISLETLQSNLWPHTGGRHYEGMQIFRDLFGILFPATSGIFAGASMSGDLKSPSTSIPVGTLWAILTTFTAYFFVILSLAASTSHGSLLRDADIIQDISLYAPTILAGELAVTFFSALMGVLGAAKLMQALARDKIFPGLSVFGKGMKKSDEPFAAILLTYCLAQVALFADLDQLASLISIFYMLTFFTMNLACFLLKIGSAPNFRPGFKFFTWQSAFAGALISAAAMFFIDGTSAATAVCLLIFLFLLLHYLSPPKHWGDISQSLIYHQVRKYLLRLRPEHIKFWRPQIILLVNDPRHQTRLIQFCNSMKKGALYVLGHVIVTSDFETGVHEAKAQSNAWSRYISEFSRIKAFVQLNMSPSIIWGVRNLILSAGLGGMRPNIAVIGFYNLEELRQANPGLKTPKTPSSPGFSRMASVKETISRPVRRRRGDTTTRLLEGHLPTDIIRTEGRMSASEYLTILEDLALRFRMNVAIGHRFQILETPRSDGGNSKKYIDLWPIQMSAELQADGKSVLTTNFDTYTLILQLGYILHSVQAWKNVYKLRVCVFVEYEEEMDPERARLNKLLEKLRIEADVLVFWLASGNLPVYEKIVSGQAVDPGTDQLVDECLKGEEWWEDLKVLRGRHQSMSASQELDSLANFVESTAGRPGVFNPHNDAEDFSDPRRRQSMGRPPRLADLPKKPTVSALSRLGVNMGIHTANLLPNVFDSGSDARSASSSDSEGDSSDDDDAVGDFNDDASAASDGDLDYLEPVRRPLISNSPGRRKSYADAQIKEPTARRKNIQVERFSKSPGPPPPPETRSYGTMSGTTAEDPAVDPDPAGPSSSAGGFPYRPDLAAVSTALRDMDRPSSPQRGVSRNTSRDKLALPSDVVQTPKPVRPSAISRHSSYAVRFSSQVMPQTEVIESEGGAGPMLGFADSSSSSQLLAPPSARPRPSRQQSRASSQVRAAASTVAFAPLEQEADDVAINIPDLLASYKLGEDGDGDGDGDAESSGGGGSSSDENGGLPLSFNDLPSRAQYLILNELLRQHSAESAVLFTTLPIPAEGTCRSEEASVQYLSDIEVLCSDLPPVLLVLSNNMTVTVSL